MAPIKLILEIQKFIGINFEYNKGENRINPYPPNFNKTAAKIIDPSTGASTCALGNQRWNKNIGIFTKKAKIKIIIVLVCSQFDLKIMKLGVCLKYRIPRRRGSDAIIV